MKTFVKVVSGLGLAVAAPLALAQFTPTPVPTTDAISQIAEISTAVLAIGGALILAAAVAVAVKWGKAAIFG